MHVWIVVRELFEDLQRVVAHIMEFLPEIIEEEQRFEHSLRAAHLCEVVKHVVTALVLVKYSMAAFIPLFFRLFFLDIGAIKFGNDAFWLRFD